MVPFVSTNYAPLFSRSRGLRTEQLAKSTETAQDNQDEEAIKARLGKHKRLRPEAFIRKCSGGYGWFGKILAASSFTCLPSVALSFEYSVRNFKLSLRLSY